MLVRWAQASGEPGTVRSMLHTFPLGKYNPLEPLFPALEGMQSYKHISTSMVDRLSNKKHILVQYGCGRNSRHANRHHKNLPPSLTKRILPINDMLHTAAQLQQAHWLSYIHAHCYTDFQTNGTSGDHDLVFTQVILTCRSCVRCTPSALKSRASFMPD